MNSEYMNFSSGEPHVGDLFVFESGFGKKYTFYIAIDLTYSCGYFCATFINMNSQARIEDLNYSIHSFTRKKRLWIHRP